MISNTLIEFNMFSIKVWRENESNRNKDCAGPPPLFIVGGPLLNRKAQWCRDRFTKKPRVLYVFVGTIYTIVSSFI